MADDVKPGNHSKPKPVLRDEKGRLLPGTAPANPLGRKTLRQELLEETDGGMEVYEFFLACMRNQLPSGQEVRVKERQAAGHWVADRIWGKAVETTVLLGLESGMAVAGQLNPDELVHLARSYAAIAAKSAAPTEKLPEVIDVTPEPKK